jgi:aminoglycoside phosphotransferase (APT) family kinase protein
MSQGSRGRDLAATKDALEQFLARRLDVATVAVEELSIPKAGFSNETVLGTATWVGSGVGNGVKHRREFVARIQPTAHQLFTTPDALRQAAVMQALKGHVAVPTVWLTETDPAVLGAPFFLMDRIHGRVPSDVPSWHQRGWAKDLTTEQRGVMHDAALSALADLHRTPVGESLRFLVPGADVNQPGKVLDAFLGEVRAMYDWCAPVIDHGRDVIDSAMRHVIEHRPQRCTTGVVWFDARMGNVMFDDELRVASLFDWEGATLGPPEFDVAWWVMFDEYLCEAQGLARLDGIPDRKATFARYEALSGRQLNDLGYYQVLAGLVLALINSRLVDLLVRNDVVAPAVGAELVTRITDMTARHL